MTASRAIRIATLVLAPLAATFAMEHAGDARFLHDAVPVLVILWIAMAVAVVARLVLETRRGAGFDRPGWPWVHLDLLTATGASTMWAGAGALAIAAVTGWASMSLIGVLALGTVYVVAIWPQVAAAGDAAWRDATISRQILPATSLEGDSLREEIRLAGVRIPAGMRLFATGRTTPHGVTTRYAVGAEAGRADVKLESDLGPAVRGEHHAPALQLWLGDTLGLTRTPVVERAPAAFSVLPRPGAIDGARVLLGAGGDDAMSRPTQHQPTDGTFRIREYVPGDDTRRIHWVRSLQANQLVMRLPDEVPPAEPAVRLVLDTELASTDALSCRAPHQLLDVLVDIWLGIARALATDGVRVTLVAAARKANQPGDPIVAIERPMIVRSPREALRLGARVAWQNELPLHTLLASGAARQLVVSARPRELPGAVAPSWVVVPESAWVSPEQWPPIANPTTLPFPIGSADNRLGRRRRERLRNTRMWHDRAVFGQVMCWADWTAFSGNYLARPNLGRVSLGVIP
ncbi:MAG TPA: DUF58 domain-containing protein [Kofleriaceae bacterium]|nr:DUF58 domain-containing protein [Kofleriaceae bacterium]